MQGRGSQGPGLKNTVPEYKLCFSLVVWLVLWLIFWSNLYIGDEDIRYVIYDNNRASSTFTATFFLFMTYFLTDATNTPVLLRYFLYKSRCFITLLVYNVQVYVNILPPRKDISNDLRDAIVAFPRSWKCRKCCLVSETLCVWILWITNHQNETRAFCIFQIFTTYFTTVTVLLLDRNNFLLYVFQTQVCCKQESNWCWC